MSEISMSKTPMRKSIFAFSLLGIIMACVIACLGAYLALFTIRDSPAAQTRFVIGFLLNVAAALVITAAAYAGEVIEAKLRGRRYLKVICDFIASAFILGLIFLSFWVIDARHNDFRALMAFTALPCSLVVLACVMAIAKEFIKCFQVKKPTS